MARVDPKAPLWLLQTGDARFLGARLDEPAGLALAADDHGVLRGLLAEAAGGRREGALRLDPSPLTRRIAAQLEDAYLLPLAPAADGAAMAAIAPLSDPAVTLRPIHRGLRGVATFHADRFLTIVRDFARIYELDAPLSTPSGLALARERIAALASGGHHAVLLVLPGGEGRVLRFRQRLDEVQIRAAPKNPTLRSLDLALLEALVLKTVLGIDEPTPGAQVVAVDALDALVAQVQSGALQAGFGLNAAPTWELRAIIEARASLPRDTLRLLPEPPLVGRQAEG